MSNDDKTSVCLMTKLVNYAGVKDCTFEYADNNSSLYDMVASGKADYAIMTEPYISMLKQGGVVLDSYDFSQDWENATEGQSYCGSALVATNEYLTQQKAVVDYMLADVERSVNSVNNDADTGAAEAVKFGLADDAKAISAAYTAMDCGFYKDKQMRFLINNMFTAFDNTNSDVFGTNVPDEDFYLVKD
jgi:ABC-type nitrate/sulfonate/bicarbonate transport system substrate-binding protein